MKTNNLTGLFLLFCIIYLFFTPTASCTIGTTVILPPVPTLADTSAINKYIRKALSYISKPQYLETMKTDIDSAESICNRTNNDFPVSLHLAKAEYNLMTGQYRKANEEATISEKQSNFEDDRKGLAMTMNFFGRYNLRIGFYDESIDNFNSSNEMAGKYNLKGFIPKNTHGIAEVYATLGKTKEYREALLKLIESAKAEKDTMFLETGYWRLGTSYSDKERNFHLADSLLRKCLEISLSKKDSNFVSLSWANLGWNFYNEKRYSSAINCYNKSLSYSVYSAKHNTSANSYGNLGTIYRDLGDFDKSLKFYKKAIYQGRLGRDIYNLSWIYHDMSDLYLRKKDTSNAYSNFVLFKQLNDSLLMSTNMKGMNDVKIRYDADRDKKELQLLSLRVSNQKLLLFGFTVLFILSLAIGVLVYSRSRINAKRRISEMNRKISEITQANLRQQMNPHFIFNTLNSIQYYMYQHDKLATNTYLTKFSSLMRKVLENSQHTSILLRDELEALKLYLELEMIRFKDRFDYEIKVDEEIDPLLYKVPTMLIQPYVENSIGHGLMPCEGKGLVKISLKLENEYISCSIEDNGIGRDASLQNKKKNEINHSSLGTQIVSSRLELVNTLYGTNLKTTYTDLKNGEGEAEGTRVEIQIPIIT